MNIKSLEDFHKEASHVFYQLKNGKIDRATAKEMNNTLNIMIKAGMLSVMESLARKETPNKQLFSNKNILEVSEDDG